MGDFIAKIVYRTTEQGGRSRLARSGIQPSVKFAFSELQTSGKQRFLDKEAVAPGETVTAEVTLASPDFLVGRIKRGMQFEVREGATITAIGEVLEIQNEALEAP